MTNGDVKLIDKDNIQRFLKGFFGVSAYGGLKSLQVSAAAYKNVKIQSLYGSQNGVSNKAAVSRAVRLQECR